MRKPAIAIIAILALCGVAKADGTGCAPSQPADATGDYQRLVDCVKQSITEAQNRLDVLRSIDIDQFAVTADGERTQFEALVKTRSDALSQANDQIATLAAERDELKRRLAATTADNVALGQKIVALEGEVEQLAADVRAAHAQNDEDGGKIKALQAVIDQLKGQLEQLDADLKASKQQQADLQAKIDDLTKTLDAAQTAVAQEATDLGTQISDLKKALGATDAKNADLQTALSNADVQIADLKKALADASTKVTDLGGKIDQLSTALDSANGTIVSLQGMITELEAKLKHAEDTICVLTNRLEPFSAEFVVGLHAALGSDPSVVVVGDRLIVDSEVLFPTGSADISASGGAKIQNAAKFIATFEKTIPSGLGWLVQVNGHTDKRPIKTRQFPSNWELSTARAVAVIKQLVGLGIPGDHLAAAGFGEFQPLATGNDATVLQHNRRIEIGLISPGVFGFGAASGSAQTGCAN